MEPMLIDDLRHTLLHLQDEEGSISPAVYDTSMVLRHAPPDNPQPALFWLLEQQASDGGWGLTDADFRARTLPTLAAILAFYKWRSNSDMAAALSRGLDWMRESAHAWAGALPNTIPVGFELLFPKLLEDAQVAGIDLPQDAYRSVRELGALRRQKIAKLPAAALPHSPATHSWEAWGDQAHDAFFSPHHGVACSPAATALWLKQRKKKADDALLQAAHYLLRATKATGQNIEGLAPPAFPITQFVHAYSLHTLAQTGLLTLKPIADLIQPLLNELEQRITPQGLGFADGFVPDSDDTAAAIGTLIAANRKVSIQPLLNFALDSHFASYRGELQPSHIATSRAIQVLDAVHRDTIHYKTWVQQQQNSDGAWLSDKWNSLWIYSTWQAILALRPDPAFYDNLRLTQHGLLKAQFSDGGWGIRCSTVEATACALLALINLPFQDEITRNAVARGRNYLLYAYQSRDFGKEVHWMAKEEYIPYRLKHIIILAALVRSQENGI